MSGSHALVLRLGIVPFNSEVDLEDIRYCERFIELVTDLEALLPTRFASLLSATVAS